MTVNFSAWNTWFTENQAVIRVIGIIVAAVIARFVLQAAGSRIIGQVVSGVKRAADVTETTQLRDTVHAQARIVQRTRTLGSVLGSLTNWALGIVATILVLSELGFEVTAIIAGAGILGAGLAVGAQDIVRDVLNGIFMVFEDQIGVGDKVNLGEVEGTVEEVTIRVTKIRDKEGSLWFVRNGQIQRVASKSHPKK
ncbi:MAG: mechanosensitive ion channel family protein [Microbacteriaceae bacterium]